MKHTKKRLNRNNYFRKRYSHKNKYNIHYGGEKKPPTTFKEDLKYLKKATKSAAEDLGDKSKKVLKKTGDYMKHPARWIDKYVLDPVFYYGGIKHIKYLNNKLLDYKLGKITLEDINNLGAIDCNEIDAKKILDDAVSLRKQGKIFLSETNLKIMEEKNIINTRDRDILSRFDNKLREKINLKFFYTAQENTNDRSFRRVFLESLNAYVEKRDELNINEPNENMLEAKKLQQMDFQNIKFVIKDFFLEHLQKLLELNESGSDGIVNPVNKDKKVESSQTFQLLNEKYNAKVNELKTKVRNNNRILPKFKEKLENLYFKQKEFIDYFKTLIGKIDKDFEENLKVEIKLRMDYLDKIKNFFQLIDKAKVDFTKTKLVGFRSKEQERGMGVNGTYTSDFKTEVENLESVNLLLSSSRDFLVEVKEKIMKEKEKIMKEKEKVGKSTKVNLASDANTNKDDYKNLFSRYFESTKNMSEKFIILSRLFTFIEDESMIAEYLVYYLFTQNSEDKTERNKKLEDANSNNFNIRGRNWFLQSNSPFLKLNNIYSDAKIKTVSPISALRSTSQAYIDAAQELEVALDIVDERNNRIQEEISELEGKVSKVDSKTGLTSEKKEKQKIIIDNLEEYEKELRKKLENEKIKLKELQTPLQSTKLKDFYIKWLESNKISALKLNKDNLKQKIDESKKTEILTTFVEEKGKLSNVKDSSRSDKDEKQIENDKKKIKMIDETLKKNNKGVDNINNLFKEFKKYHEVKTLLNIKDDNKINIPINDRLIKEINKIFFPFKYGEEKSREELQKRDVDFFGALYKRFVYLRLSIIRYNINKIFQYKDQEDKKGKINELITSNAYLLYFLVNEFVKVLRMHPVKDFLLKGTDLNPNLDSLSFFKSIEYKPSVTIQEILKIFKFDPKSKYIEPKTSKPGTTVGGASEDKYKSLNDDEKYLVKHFFSFLILIINVTQVKSYLDKEADDRKDLDNFLSIFKAKKLVDPVLKGKDNFFISSVFKLKLLSSEDIKLQAKCRNLKGDKLNDCRKDYDKTRLNKFIGKAGVLEHILRLYIGVHLKELDPSTNWSQYAQIGDDNMIRASAKGKSVSKALTKKTKKKGMELGQGVMRAQAALFSKITSMKAYPNLNADAVEVLKEFLSLYPNWDIAKASITDDDYKRIQKGLDEYGFKRKSEMEVVKDFTFIEHFIFALCSKKGSFSGKMKYTSRNFEGANKTTEVEKSKQRSERRAQGSAYQKATRALKGETKEFGFTNPKALMETAKVGGAELRESNGVGAATVGKARELLSNIGDRTGCFFKRFVTINGKKEEICGKKRALTDEEVKALEKGEIDFNEFAKNNFTKGRRTSQVALKGVKNVGKYAVNKQKILSDLGRQAIEGKPKPAEVEYSNKQISKILDGGIPTKRCFEKYIYEAMKAIDCKKIKSDDGRKNCKQTKKDKKTENKDTCAKKNFKSSLDKLYCYKELYDKNGKEKFRGEVKFLCRRNHCAPQPDPICDELNVCKNLRPRIRDIPKEARYLYGEFKKMILSQDPSGAISKLGSYGGIKSGVSTGLSKFKGRIMSKSEFNKALKAYEKYRKKTMKQNLKKQFNVFKKTPEGKQYMKYENAIKKSLSKSKKQTVKKESKKKIKPGQREKRLAKLQKNKEQLKLNREKLKNFEKEICEGPDDEKCQLLKDAIKYRKFDTDTKLFKYAKGKLGTKKKKKK